MKQRCNNQGTEIQRFQNAAKEAYDLAAKQSSKHKTATEALKSVAEQVCSILFLFLSFFLKFKNLFLATYHIILFSFLFLAERVEG